MILCTDTPQFRNDIGEIIRLFFDAVDVELLESHVGAQESIRHRLVEREGTTYSVAEYFKDGEEAPASVYEYPVMGGGASPLEHKKYLKRAVKTSVFRALKKVEPVYAPWGSLTGIRPTKLVRELLTEHSAQDVRAMLQNVFDVSPQKADLAIKIVGIQQEVLLSQRENDIDVYIGIPFCRTRCSYCSFAAYELGKGCATDIGVETYLQALEEEIRCSAKAANEGGYVIRSLYMGGGTPTALTTKQLAHLIDVAQTAFNGSGREFTVEAGRPDTLDREKLSMLKSMGVDRISINPQSMNAQTLERVGRSHSPESIVDCFTMAREMDFDSINMDVIVGLPGETPAMVEHTLSRIAQLSPDNLTVHTLAIKRSSRLKEQLLCTELPSAEEAENMTALGERYAAMMGMVPYYMYRQKYMRGNLENVGYCAANKPSIYNIDIMEETTSILALGAGAITKWVYGGNRVERAANPKDMATYLEKGSEMNRRREALMKADHPTGFAGH